MSDLKNKANPLNALSSALALEIKYLRKGQLKTNKRLGEICLYKQQQQDGDIKFRKSSTKMGLLSVVIALTALYISIAGADSAFAEIVRATLKGWGVL